jgi:hypothetical protein
MMVVPGLLLLIQEDPAVPLHMMRASLPGRGRASGAAPTTARCRGRGQRGGHGVREFVVVGAGRVLDEAVGQRLVAGRQQPGHPHRGGALGGGELDELGVAVSGAHMGSSHPP